MIFLNIRNFTFKVGEFMKKIDYREELTEEEEKIKKLLVTKNFFDTYDEVVKKDRKKGLENIFYFSLAWSIVDVFTKDNKASSTLLMITIYSLLEMLKYYIGNMKMYKILNETDLDELSMNIYNSQERMKGLNNALYYNAFDCDDRKVYCIKK